ncbi:UMP kinase activity protein [Homalodisca vitripennis]|nr:UMP kinase activity protein [Homalodisca vitripennis]
MISCFNCRVLRYFSVCSLFIISSTASSMNSSEDSSAAAEPIIGANCKMKNLGIFYSEKEIFDILMDERNRNRRNVSDLIRVYKEKCCSLAEENTNTTKPRRPFIVVESNHRPPRKLVAKQLADILGGEYISVPPKCLREFLYTFDYSGLLRRAYFGLSLYATAYEVKAVYHKKPVVTSGYWSDQTSFAISKEYDLDKIPEVGHSIYTWPEDLLKPDVSFLMNVPQRQVDGYATTMLPDNFQEKRIVAFRRMRRPRLREIKDIFYYDTILTQMQSKMLNVFMHPRWKRKNVRY